MWQKALGFYTRYFVVWVILLGLAALYRPAPFQWVGGYKVAGHIPLLNLFFSVTLLGIGMVLRLEDFKRILERPGLILIGTLAQFIIMPVGSFLVAKAFALQPDHAVGLIIAGAAPDAMAGNALSYVAHADTAYNVSLTTVSTVLCPILTPALTRWLAGSILPVDVWKMVFELAYMVIVPLLLGFAARQVLGDRVDRIQAVFPALSVTFIMVICAVVLAGSTRHLRAAEFSAPTARVLGACLALNALGLAGGYWVGVLFAMSVAQRRALAIQVGMQNAALGAALAKSQFGDQAALPPVLFVFLSLVTGALLVGVWQRGRP
ncbi:MAG: bile acid:sodium symporter family protein [Phycisphaerae bacterium]|nr:bile acid:sodium symporter family protein [Phycisphaerae bacterium]